jgi:hypothetical protein
VEVKESKSGISSLQHPVIRVDGKLQHLSASKMLKGPVSSGMKVWVIPPQVKSHDHTRHFLKAKVIQNE